MRKRLLAGLCVIGVGAAVGVAAPFYSGLQAEKAITGFSQTRAGEVLISHSVDSYQRHYASAYALGRVALEVPTQDTRLELKVEHRIKHGLMGATVESTYFPAQTPGAPEQSVWSRFDTRGLFTTTTRVGPRATTVDVRVPTLQETTSEGFLLETREAAGRMVVKGRELEGEFHMPHLHLAEAGSSLTVTDQLLTFRLQNRDDPLGAARLDYGIDRFELVDQHADVTVSGFAMAVEQSVTNALLTSVLELRMATLAIDGNEVQDLTASVMGESLDRGLLAAVIKTYDSGERVSAAELEQLAAAFLAASPAVKVRFAMGPQGAERAMLSWTLGYSAGEAPGTSLNDHLGLLTGLHSELLATLSDTGLLDIARLGGQVLTQDDIEHVLGMAVTEGLLVRTATGYEATASLESGNVLLNGRARPELILILAMLFAGIR